MNIIQVYKQFPTQDACLLHLEKVRWNGTPVCPYCKSTKTTPMKNEKRHHCNTCNTTFSVTVGTMFHKTKLDFQKWFVAISLVLNAKKGISARQLARDIEVNKDTAWSMAMRIRRAMTEQGELLKGIVEIDETYVGGKPRKFAYDVDKTTGEITPKKNKRGRGTSKPAVVGMVERGGRVSAKVFKGAVTAKELSKIVRERVDIKDAIVISDEFRGYCELSGFVQHQTINHKRHYVNGEIHTNTIEGFWGLFKRGIVGQYHKVSVGHLGKYIAEFCFRYNNRNNVGVFDLTIAKALGV